MSDREALKDEYIDHMMNPRNYGSIENYSGKGIGKNPHNNELVEMYLLVDENENIKDIKFQAIGCMSTAVTGSIFTDIVKGESLEEADDVADEFLKKIEFAPKEERACAEMVAKGFMAAEVNYRHRKEGKEEAEYTLLISEDCVVSDEK
jgi:nitrogen fixation NifU-like protein